MTKSELDSIIRKFKKPMTETLKLWDGYEALRTRYDIWKYGQNPEAIRKFNQVCRKMQKIEAQIESLWKPHRRAIGACTKCGRTRMPAVMGKRSGLGCCNSDCHHFEVVKKKAS